MNWIGIWTSRLTIRWTKRLESMNEFRQALQDQRYLMRKRVRMSMIVSDQGELSIDQDSIKPHDWRRKRSSIYKHVRKDAECISEWTKSCLPGRARRQNEKPDTKYMTDDCSPDCRLSSRLSLPHGPCFAVGRLRLRHGLQLCPVISVRNHAAKDLARQGRYTSRPMGLAGLGWRGRCAIGIHPKAAAANTTRRSKTWK